jgi:hypothetical protein
MSERYVQHKSGQGEKYRVEKEHEDYWEVTDNRQEHWFLRLPKHGEYIECAAPEVWTDVASSATITHPRRLDIAQIRNNDEEIVYVHLPDGYRFAWRGNALVIERRQA